MKIYISVDMEGITGVAGSYQVQGPMGSLPEVKELATADVNAAIDGAKEAGATTIWMPASWQNPARTRCTNITMKRRAKDTLTAIEMNRGDVEEFEKINGGVLILR